MPGNGVARKSSLRVDPYRIDQQDLIPGCFSRYFGLVNRSIRILLSGIL